MKANVERIGRRIDRLAEIIDPALPPYTRRAFTETFRQGREWLAGEFGEAGLTAGVDAGGNLVGQRAGSEAGLLPIALGSHSDTVMGGGRFDGIAGVVAALEVAQVLGEEGKALRHPLWIYDCLAEEPTDYGVSCIGSRALAGTLTEEMLALSDEAGETLAEGLRRVGGDPELALRGPIHGPRPLAAFMELHIEQGPVLEGSSLPVGVVSGVVGIRRMRITVTGQADHAGTTPMTQRRDALAGAAELIAAIHREGRAEYERNGLVATVGHLINRPNAPNVVPAQVEMIFESRCADMAAVRAFTEGMVASVDTVMREWGLKLEATLIGDVQPTPFADPIRGVLRDAALEAGLEFREMQSGAGHDAMHIAAVAPAGMIFIPCRAGRSHASEEFATPEAVATGTAVLMNAVLALDRNPPP